jgi:acyl carrier protein
MGMTEACASPAWWFLTKDSVVEDYVLSVGYPAEDMEISLLDDNGGEVNVSEAGEIAVKSRYLARGYWRRPELTQRKFLTDSTDGKVQLYVTGDLGRILSDGKLVHLGRKDLQVKVRGRKVQPEEIEMALAGLDSISQATVLLDQAPGSSEARLIAYIILATHLAPTVTELRNCLEKKLPEYMIPSVFVVLDAFPIAPTGKVDRLALPVPPRLRPDLETVFVTPVNQVQEKLAAIWADMFDLDRIGIHDNFFDLGGHSLLAMRLVSQVVRDFHIEMPLQSLFQSPTVAKMAVVIMEHQGKRLAEEDLGRMLGELELLADEEATRLLTGNTATKSGGDRNE